MVSEFLGWWLSQLADLFPERWYRFGSRDADAVVIAPVAPLSESVDSVQVIPALPAVRAAASSPRGYMSRQLPTGARISGMGSEMPSTVVRRSHTGVATAQRGRNVTASNARQFARNVHSPSAPPSM